MNDARERETQAAAESSHGSNVTSGTGLPRDPEKQSQPARAKLGDESSSLARVLQYMTHEQLVQQCVSLSERADRLLASLEGLHFHHKMYEPDCRHCQTALRKVSPDDPLLRPADETTGERR